MVTREEIENLAALSRISLTTEEAEKMRGEFDAILKYVAAIQKIPSLTKAGRAPITTVNVMREDANPHESGVYTDALLSAAPTREGQYIRVKKIL